MAPTAPLDDSDDDAAEGRTKEAVGPAAPLDGWVAAPPPVVFKELRLRLRRLPRAAAATGEVPAYRPKHGPMQRSHCVVHLQRLGSRSGEEAFEFVTGEAEGFARPPPGAPRLPGGDDGPWSPPNRADAVAVPRWATEAVLALEVGEAAEFEAAAEEDGDASGGLLGRCRLTLLEARPAQDLLGDGGVVLHFLDGSARCDGPKPRDLARVSASWRVWFARNGELLLGVGTLAEGNGSSEGREFTIDENGLMVALELAFKELRPGSHACVRISEEWATGSLTPEGNPNLRGAAIWAELILHSVQNEPAPGEHGDVAAALEFALAKKQQGNSSLALETGSDVGRAARRYEAGIQALEAVLPEGKCSKRPSSSPEKAGPLASEEELPSVEEALTALRLNAAQAELKRCRWKEAADHCTVVLHAAEGNAKARFRRGLARAELGQLAGAVEDLRRALAANPANAAARRELTRVEALRKEKKAEERSTFGGLFEKMRQKDEAREQREEARRKAEEEQEAKRKREEAEQKRREAAEQRRRQAEEAAAKEAADKEAAAKEASANEASAREASANEAGANEAAAKEVAAQEVAAAPAEPLAAAPPAVAAGPVAEAAGPRSDGELLEAIGREEGRRGDKGGPGSVLPLMPPPDIPVRTVDKAPPIDYEVPAFLRRGSAKKKAKG